CCQGQRAGRCSVHWRAERVSRPGICSSRRRRVRVARTVWPGSPIRVVQRSRLCARQAITVQAALALNLPEGKCASAWSLRSRIVSSTRAVANAGVLLPAVLADRLTRPSIPTAYDSFLPAQEVIKSAVRTTPHRTTVDQGLGDRPALFGWHL